MTGWVTCYIKDCCSWPVSVHDSERVLSEPQYSAVFKLCVDQLSDQVLCFQVYTRKGLFHKQDSDPCKQGSGQTEQPPLAKAFTTQKQKYLTHNNHLFVVPVHKGCHRENYIVSWGNKTEPRSRSRLMIDSRLNVNHIMMQFVLHVNISNLLWETMNLLNYLCLSNLQNSLNRTF